MPPSGPPPASARPTRARAVRFVTAVAGMGLLLWLAQPRYYYALRAARLTRRTVRLALFFVALTALCALVGALRTATGALNFDNAADAFCASVFAAVTAVARVCFHSEVAVATDDSTRLLTSRIALVSTAEPSLTSVRKVLPASVRAQSRVTAAAPRPASHIWR